jgi:hypothetical protein
MATQIVQGGSGRASLSEQERDWILCQLKAAIRVMWPEDFCLKRADLTVIQGGKGSADRFPFLQDDETKWEPSPLTFEADASEITEASP